MFENLKKLYLEEKQKDIEHTINYIKHGREGYSDIGLINYSTDKRWCQYENKEITREKAVDFAIKRYLKKVDKDIKAKLEYIDQIANAPTLDNISVTVEWSRSATWGYNPHASVYANKLTYGSASGCGYDKRSAAVAEAFDDNLSILKVLYIAKEQALNENIISDNHSLLGYGSGYGALPYFEGGVGVGCFWRILENCGFKLENTASTRSSDYYYLRKVAL